VDRNPQIFADIPNAKPEDFKKATEQVFHQKNAKGAAENVQPRGAGSGHAMKHRNKNAAGVDLMVLPQ